MPASLDVTPFLSLAVTIFFIVQLNVINKSLRFFLSLNFSLTENGATLTYSIDCVYLVYSDLAIVFSDLPSVDQDSKISSKKSGSGTYSSKLICNMFLLQAM